MEKPFKKIIRKKTILGIVGVCECGHEHKFSAKDFNLESANKSIAFFKEIYTCPKCGNKYDGMYDTTSSNSIFQNISIVGVLLTILMVVGLLYGGYKIVDAIAEKGKEHEYPKDFKDLTNRQLMELLEIEQKQKIKEWENKKAFEE